MDFYTLLSAHVILFLSEFTLEMLTKGRGAGKYYFASYAFAYQ